MTTHNLKRSVAALVVGALGMLCSAGALALSIGDKAPAFSLPATIGKQASLASYPGKTLVLFFYPGAFTNACTQEALTFQLDLPKFEAANAQVVGISVDFNGTNQAWAEKLGLKFPLLSDTGRAMTRAYGALNDDASWAGDPKRISSYLRADAKVIVVDKQGVVRYMRDTRPRGTIPVEEVLAEVEKLK